MARFILQDAGVVGLLCSAPSLPNVASALEWLSRRVARDAKIVLTDLTDYEVRRELDRLGAIKKLGRLERLRDESLTIGVSHEAWVKASEFWAITRREGRPTADPHSLDGDTILAGVAATVGPPGDSVTIATTNVGHLSRFPGIDARSWESIEA
ncbi:type II toxin-antitoxin system VapC family toxin [Tundrisphaera sp. TA3]|uniref:type II toxin-antitoxin system VapC family toxin n=1 Tax=Tundrisphaera sp. TA3 TaxID=3435775 RepID=UPI003EB9EC6A